MTNCPLPSPLCYDVPNWMDNWMGDDSYCVRAINCLLFRSASGYPSITNGELIDPELFIPGGAASTMIEYVQTSFINPMFEAYNRDGYRIGSRPNEGTYSGFQNNMFAMCSSVPGMCSQYVSNICSSQTEASISNNPYISQWCGCYMGPEVYRRYDAQGVTPQCTPTCARQGVIPRMQERNYTIPVTCKNNVCVMNDVTISLNDTQLSGGISFSQYCGGCGNGSEGRCTCIIDDVSITVLEKSLDNINLSQSCGSTKCQKTINGKLTDVSCTTGLPFIPTVPKTNQVLIIALIFISILILLLFLWVLRTPKKKDTKGQ